MEDISFRRSVIRLKVLLIAFLRICERQGTLLNQAIKKTTSVRETTLLLDQSISHGSKIDVQDVSRRKPRTNLTINYTSHGRSEI